MIDNWADLLQNNCATTVQKFGVGKIFKCFWKKTLMFSQVAFCEILLLLFTNNVHIKENRCRHLISIMTSAIYQVQHKLAPALKHAFFGALNNGVNTSNLASANVSKLHCVIHFNTLHPYILRLKGKLLQMHIQ